MVIFGNMSFIGGAQFRGVPGAEKAASKIEHRRRNTSVKRSL